MDEEPTFSGFESNIPEITKPKKRKKSYGGPKCFHCGEVITGPIVFKGPNVFHKDCPRHAGKVGPTGNGA